LPTSTRRRCPAASCCAEGRAPGPGHRRALHPDRLLAPLAQYQNFLLLIGSVFAPLFGVVLVDHFILRRRAGAGIAGCAGALLAWAGG
jgi:hypothetical protein